MPRFIHLLYVPTLACNMACKYCYLEDNTVDRHKDRNALETLDQAVKQLIAQDIYPFDISLHGGEVTCLSTEEFHDLIAYIANYYETYGDMLREAGFKIGTPHIKTNLFALDRHLDTIKEYQVSISGSLDLPLKLHEQYRVTKGDQSTLQKILDNIALLETIDNKKKVSATIFKEHYDELDEIIQDIKFLHKNTCLDMNDFNFMIGFDYQSNGILHPMSEDEQVTFFHRMHEAFAGSDLDRGLNGAWFAEFGPTYCTNCDNCGEKFYLLEKNGDVYSCVRGQHHENFHYGNIFENSVEEILLTAQNKIFTAHNQLPMHEDCLACDYLYLCKTGCPFVKNLYQSNRSYTCKLQQELYKKQGYMPAEDKEEARLRYLEVMRPDLIADYQPKREPYVFIQSDLHEIIAADPRLKYIYDPTCFVLQVDGVDYPLESQILKTARPFVYWGDGSQIVLYIKDNVLDEEADYPQSNSLYIQLLSGDLTQYGDEGRTKQRHIMSHQVFKDTLTHQPSDRAGFYRLDIGPLLQLYKGEFSKTNANNLFFTTMALRDYHYTKHKKNAYYHIQAIDLPFQNIEFFYIDENDLSDFETVVPNLKESEEDNCDS